MPTLPPPPTLLQRVKALYQAGLSERKIASLLETEGLPPLPGRKAWNRSAVRACLQHPGPTPSAPAPRPTPPPPPPLPSAPTTDELTVKIRGPWIRTDGLLWEFLLHKVWDELAHKPDHTIPIEEALAGLRLAEQRRDRAHLCDALERLARSCVLLDGTDGVHLLTVATPLLSAALTKTTLNFQFPTALLKLIKNPEQYVHLQELLAAKS